MRCKQCGKELPLFKKLADNDFCSAEHRSLFVEAQHQVMLTRLRDSGRRMKVRTLSALEREPLVAPPPDPNPPPRPLFGVLAQAPPAAHWLGPFWLGCDPAINHNLLVRPTLAWTVKLGLAPKVNALLLEARSGIRGLWGAARPLGFEPLVVPPLFDAGSLSLHMSVRNRLAPLPFETFSGANQGAGWWVAGVPQGALAAPLLPKWTAAAGIASFAGRLSGLRRNPRLHGTPGTLAAWTRDVQNLPAAPCPAFPATCFEFGASQPATLSRLYRMRPRNPVACPTLSSIQPIAAQPAVTAPGPTFLPTQAGFAASQPVTLSRLYRMRPRNPVACSTLSLIHSIAAQPAEYAISPARPSGTAAARSLSPRARSKAFRMRAGGPVGWASASALDAIEPAPAGTAGVASIPAARVTVRQPHGLASFGRAFRFRPRSGVKGAPEFERISGTAAGFCGTPAIGHAEPAEPQPRCVERLFRTRPRAGLTDARLAPFHSLMPSAGSSADGTRGLIPALLCGVIDISAAPPVLTRPFRMRPKSGIHDRSVPLHRVSGGVEIPAAEFRVLPVFAGAARTCAPNPLERLYKMRPKAGIHCAAVPELIGPVGETAEWSPWPVLPQAAAHASGRAPAQVDRLYRMRPRTGTPDKQAAAFELLAAEIALTRPPARIPAVETPRLETHIPAVVDRPFRMRPRSGMRGSLAALPARPEPLAIGGLSQIPGLGQNPPRLTLLDKMFRMRPRGIAGTLAATLTAAPLALASEVAAKRPVMALPSCAPLSSDRLIRNRPRFGVPCIPAMAVRDIETGPIEDSEIFVMPPVPELHVVRVYELPRPERSNRLGPPSASVGSTDPDTEGIEPLDGAMVARTMLASSMVSGFELFREGLTVVGGLSQPQPWMGLREKLRAAAPLARAWGWFRVPAMRLATCGACVMGFMVLWSTSDSSVSSASAVTASAAATQKTAVATTVSTVRQMVYERSATDLKDDFSVGLSDWEGGPDWSASWNYDERGGVKPGSLAILKPSVELADYTFEFLGEIERNTLGFTVRSADVQNYQAVKLVVKTPGPLPEVSVVRYAVVDGKISAQSEKRLPLTVYKDTIYQVRVTARGDTFTLAINDLVVDDWTESRLGSGGVGFFTPKGDQARVFQVRVYHQADTLGKALAYLAKK